MAYNIPYNYPPFNPNPSPGSPFLSDPSAPYTYTHETNMNQAKYTPAPTLLTENFNTKNIILLYLKKYMNTIRMKQLYFIELRIVCNLSKLK
jgi:hypothetical protein